VHLLFRPPTCVNIPAGRGKESRADVINVALAVWKAALEEAEWARKLVLRTAKCRRRNQRRRHLCSAGRLSR